MLPRIHCITDFPSYDDHTIAVLQAVVRGGFDAVQVRAWQSTRLSEGDAVEAGELARYAGRIPRLTTARASSPMTGRVGT